MTRLKFKQGIICDDIRQEMNGKFIIIGVYSSSFIPSRLPLATQIAFGVWAEVEGPGPHKCEFEMSLEPDGSPVASAQIQFELPSDEREVFIPSPKLPVTIGSPGYIVLREKRSDQEIIRLRISPPPNTTETPLSQPPTEDKS